MSAAREAGTRPTRDGRAPEAGDDEPLAWGELVKTLIHSRQTLLPRRLAEPGPDDVQLDAILAAAAAAPDHGQLTPWRFVIVPPAARARLGEAFAAALLARDATATPEQVAQAREKAFRAPLLLLAIGRLADEVPTGEGAGIDATERLISAGCALQNMLLTAHALGFGAALTSGKALQSEVLRGLFRLSPGERALCFLSVGTVAKPRAVRARPLPASYVSVLETDGY